MWRKRIGETGSRDGPDSVSGLKYGNGDWTKAHLSGMKTRFRQAVRKGAMLIHQCTGRVPRAIEAIARRLLSTTTHGTCGFACN